MDTSVEETIKMLNAINTPRQLKCLEAFLQAYDLVSWLRKNTNDLKEFKFLVDIILTNKSNENALSASTKHAFAITLKDACVGYAALIYELKPDVDGFQRFIQLCEKLWENFKSDPKLPNKLIDIKGLLD